MPFKEFITYISQEKGMKGHMEKHQVWSGGRKEQRKPRSELLLDFLHERQGRAGEID